MDWRVLRAIYDVSLDHHWIGTLFSDVEKASIPFMVAVCVVLWLAARPGGSRKWKLASGSALGAAALAVLVNLAIHVVWDRPRPYESHTFRHPWSTSTDSSFPSVHTSASFAIAFAVMLIDPLVGVVVAVAAALIAIGRLFIAAHYPTDILGGVAVGFVAAVVVVRLARPLIMLCVRLVERLTDPVLARVWRANA
jgi:membrane-associated phospholipid phosphatase